MTGQYECQYCQKTFVLEIWHEKHMMNVHPLQHHGSRLAHAIEESEEELSSADEDYLSDQEVMAESRTLLEDDERALEEMPTMQAEFTTTRHLEDSDFESGDEDEERAEEQRARAYTIPASPDTPTSSSGTTENEFEHFPIQPTIVGPTPNERKVFHASSSTWAPFANGHEFKVANWIVSNGLTDKAVNEYFNHALARIPSKTPEADRGGCFTSAYLLHKILDNLDPEMSPMHTWREGISVYSTDGRADYKFRSAEAMIRNIFRQPVYAEAMIYTPIKEYVGCSQKRFRVFGGPHTANWWWREQVTASSHTLMACAYS